MNKEQAAKFLEVSEKTIQRYTKQGFLNPTQINGKLIYEENELLKLKANRTSQTQHVHTVQDIRNSLDMSNVQPNVQALSLQFVEQLPAIGRRLSEFSNSLLGIFERGSIAIERIAVALEGRPAALPTKPTIAITDKLLLSLQEASDLSGLPKARLLRAIKEGKLIASKQPSWKIKRKDLEKFIESI